MPTSLTTTEKAKRHDRRVARDKRDRARTQQIGGMFWMGGSAVVASGVSELLFTKVGRLRHFDKEAKVPTSPILGGLMFAGGALFEMPVLAGAGLGPLCVWAGNWTAQQSWAQSSGNGG